MGRFLVAENGLEEDFKSCTSVLHLWWRFAVVPGEAERDSDYYV